MKISRRAAAAALAVSLPLATVTVSQPAGAQPAEVQAQYASRQDIEKMLQRFMPVLTPEVVAGLSLLALVIAGLLIAPVAEAMGSSFVPSFGDVDGENLRGGKQYKRGLPGGRTYNVILPEGYEHGKTYPVIIGFGGWQHTAEQARGYQRLEDYARDTIVVYAQGKDNAWGGAPYASESLNSDISYVRDVINDVASKYGGDRNRVAAVGLSNGGGMAAALACHAPDTVKAVATVAGAFYNPTVTGCTPGAVPTLIMHGTADDIVSYYGGTRHGAPYKSVNQVFDTFRTKNGCGNTVSDTGTWKVTTTTAQRCNAETVLQTVRGGGHTWFPSSPAASEETTKFLSRHL